MSGISIKRAGKKGTSKKAIYFNDIVGSSALWKAHPEGMMKALGEFVKLSNKTIKRHKSGRILRFMGDALLVDFNTTKQAIEFALDLQGELIKKPIRVHKNKLLLLRSGIAYGELNKVDLKLGDCKSVDYYGNVINTASRMESKVSPVGGLGIAVISKDPKEVDKIRKLVASSPLFEVSEVIEFAEDRKCRGVEVPASQVRNSILCQDSSMLKGVDPTLAIKVSPRTNGSQLRQ